MKESDATVPDQVNLLKKLYTLQQVELFAELHFEWSSFKARESENLIEMMGEESDVRETGDHIPCCVGSPAINFVTRPIQVRIRNEREIETVRLHEPFTVEYEILNLTSKVIFAISEF